MVSPHYSCALLTQWPMPDSSETGGKSATGRDKAYTSRESRSSRLSRVSALSPRTIMNHEGWCHRGRRRRTGLFTLLFQIDRIR